METTAQGPGGDPRSHSQSIHVDAAPEDVYALVSDVTRTGEWSPVCTGCSWDEGAGPEVGAWFTGHNAKNGREWDTRSRVVAAEPGEEFAWVVGGSYVRWGFALEPEDGGTRLTESWRFLPDGLAMFHDRYGDRAPAQIEERTRDAHAGIPATLRAVKGIVEGAAA